MSDKEKYNGWSNRETWLTNLWLDSDEELNGLFRETVDRAMQNGETIDRISDRLYFVLKKRIMTETNENHFLQKLALGLAVGTFLSKVNFREIVALAEAKA